MTDWKLAAIVMAVSVASHGVTYVVLGEIDTSGAMADRFARVDIEVIEPEAPEPPPEPEPPEPEVEEAPEPPEPPPPVVRRERPPPPPEEAPPPPPQEETPVAFDNLVLTNENHTGAGWAVEQGSGREATGPIGPPGVETGRRREGVRNGMPEGTGAPTAGPPVVALSNLSRRPAPPSGLNALLERNYPRALRQQGVEGEAVVRIRVNPNGSLTVLGTASETQAGFGDACMRTLRAASDWTPPLDANGRAVATVTRFTCEFTVRY